MKHRLTTQSGFSMIEALAAMVILGGGVLVLASMQGIALGRNVDAAELTRGTNLASDIIERIQFNRQNVNDYNNINTTGTVPCPATMPMVARGDCQQWKTLLEDVNAHLTNVQGTVSVTAIGPTSPPLNQRQVIVQVTWLGSINGDTIVKRQKTITMQTIVAPE
jgi:type IV pilus assembly protein PilV